MPQLGGCSAVLSPALSFVAVWRRAKGGALLFKAGTLVTKLHLRSFSHGNECLAPANLRPFAVVWVSAFGAQVGKGGIEPATGRMRAAYGIGMEGSHGLGVTPLRASSPPSRLVWLGEQLVAGKGLEGAELE